MSKTNTEYNKEYYKKNKEKVLAKNKAWNDTHSERLKELSAKRYAERPKPEPKPRQPRPRKFTSKHERYRHYQYKRLYGITLEQYNAMLAEQHGVCKICSKPPETRLLSVDHCHNTKKIRGLICQHCNMGLANFKDNIEALERAVKYLKGEL